MTGLESYVGQFIRHGNDLGVIDEICGNKLGFVWSDKTSWTGQLVCKEDVTLCETEEDCSAALNSAREYFAREADSLRNRIKQNIKTDDSALLAKLLRHCENWIDRLG